MRVVGGFSKPASQMALNDSAPEMPSQLALFTLVLTRATAAAATHTHSRPPAHPISPR